MMSSQDQEPQTKEKSKHLTVKSRSPTGSVAEDSGPPSPTSGLIPNFGIVGPGIFRSSFPHAANLTHLQSLNLRTLVTLVPTTFASEVITYVKTAGIRHHRILIPAHKDGAEIPLDALAKVIRLIRDPSSKPLLIHCNKGKHRTGCVIGALRKLKSTESTHAIKDEDLPQPLAEYHQYAREKARVEDTDFIDSLDINTLSNAMEGVKLPITPIDYSLGHLPTPPMSTTSETDLEQELADLNYTRPGSLPTCMEGGHCQADQDGVCPFLLQHELEACL